MPINGEFVSKARPRLAHRGVKLLGLVYEELYRELGHDFSTAELMAAAQTLIDISKEEYLDPQQEQIHSKPDYHSEDVFTAFERSSWQIACTEEGNDHLGDDRASHNMTARRRLRQLLYGT